MMPLPPRAPRKIWSALILSATLTACTTTTASVATEPGQTACAVFAPLRWSKDDTDDTIRAAKLHNAAGKSLCGWGR